MGWLKELRTIHNQLIKACRSWALKTGYDPERTRELRHEAILRLHNHYLENIPAYQTLAREEECGKAVDVPTIKNKLMSSADIFKSYSQEWIDSGDYGRMNQWLSNLYGKRLDIDVQGIKSVDDWIERLQTAGIQVSYSSGTSGTFSFVPRDPADWKQAKIANTNYLAPLLTYSKTGTFLTRLLVKPALRLLSPEAFAGAAGRAGIRGFDGVFLGFRSGRMGNQVLMQELAPNFRKHYFLYNIDLTATALRCLRRGAKTSEEKALLERFQTEVSAKRDENYRKIFENMQISTRSGQKVFIFGAPAQFKDLCQLMSGQNQKLALKKGSLILFGGGWKSFTGEVLSRETLVSMLSEVFGLPPDRILEGYSMTEINMLMLRCDAGRFHIPPLIEPVVFDEELSPLEGNDIKGTFGFLDPLAVSYPGFLITGDYIRMVEGDCACGLCGPAVTEIGRAKGREIKGCGGIMGSIKA
jgi:hypothetical protein